MVTAGQDASLASKVSGWLGVVIYFWWIGLQLLAFDPGSEVRSLQQGWNWLEREFDSANQHRPGIKLVTFIYQAAFSEEKGCIFRKALTLACGLVVATCKTPI